MLQKRISGLSVLLLILIIYVLSGCTMIKTVPTKKVVDGVFAVSDLFVNMYLINTGENYIAIDAGFRSGTVAKRLKNLNIDSDSIVAVLLTHSHFDHIAALSLFKNANIYISSEEKEYVDQGKAGLGGLKKGMGIKYILLNDKQIVEIKGIKIKGILTPGHTAGSMCYLIDDKYLFVGDVLGFDSKGRAKITPKWLNEDTKMQKKTTAKFTELPDIQYIFSSHGGYTDNFNEAFENWND